VENIAGTAIRRVAAGRRLDGEAVERVVFALLAQRACEPGSKLAATGWVAQRVAIAGCPPFSDDAAHAAMDFLLDSLSEIAAEVFGSVRARESPLVRLGLPGWPGRPRRTARR
jgi:hypothetical protein